MAIVSTVNDKIHNSLLCETDDVEDSSETDTLKALHARSRRTTTARHTTGTEDALKSYLCDIRGLSLLLTPAEEVELAQRAAAGLRAGILLPAYLS